MGRALTTSSGGWKSPTHGGRGVGIKAHTKRKKIICKLLVFPTEIAKEGHTDQYQYHPVPFKSTELTVAETRKTNLSQG